MKPKNNTAKFRSQAFGACLSSAIVVCFTGAAFAADWNGSVSTDWNNNANWNGGGGTGGSNAVINTSTPNFASITANIVATPIDIFIGNTGGANGRVDHSAGNAQTGNGNWMFVGTGGGTGVYNLANTSGTGGTLTGFAQGTGNMTSNRLWIGGLPWAGGGNGTVNVNTTGVFDMNDLAIGDNGGTGVMNVDSGTINTHGWNFIGKDEGGGNNAHGTLNMSGGTLNNTGRTWVGLSNTTGVINLSGGSYKQLNNELMSVGDGTNGNGTVIISNSASLLQANGELWFGQNNGTGLLTFSAGTITSGNWVAIGRDNGNGTVNMTGGTWTKVNGGSSFIVGASGPGTMNQSGGLVDVQGGDTWMGENNVANYTLSGTGEFRATYFQVARNGSSTGNVNLNGGTLRANQIVGGSGAEHVHFNGTQIIAKQTQPNFIAGMDGSGAVIDGGGLKIDSAGFTLGVPQTLTGTGGVVKSGAGKVTLSAFNTYTGSNTVNAGELVLRARVDGTGTGDMTVADGTALGVSAAYTNDKLTPANATFGTTGTTTLNLDMGNVNGTNFTNSILDVTGNLVLNGNVTVNVSGSKFAAGTMPLVSYVPGNKTGAGSFVLGTLPNGVVASLVDDTIGGLVYLNITSVALPEWDGTNVPKYVKTGDLTTGLFDVVVSDATNIVVGQKAFGVGIPAGATVTAISGLTITLDQAATATSSGTTVIFSAGAGTNDGVWDVNTTQNWVDQVTTNLSVFKNANPVLFSDLATGPTAVTLDTTVSPSEVVFNNSVKTYSLTGTGKITGAASLTKSGTQPLSISTDNDYTGVTTLSGGTTTVGTLTNAGVASPLGAASSAASNLVLSGATLNYTGATVSIDRGFTTGGADGAITVPGGTDLTISGPVTGSLGSSFNKQGDGSLILSNSSVTIGAGGQVNEILAGTLKLSGPGQTVSIPGELWVGSVPAAAGHLILDSTSLTVGSWLTLGRGNGDTGLLSTITATNSTIVCGNFSTGYDNGLPNDSDQTVTLTNSSITTNGVTYLGERANTTNIFSIDAGSVYNANGRFLTSLGTGSVCTITVQGTLNHTAEWMSVGNSNNAICTMTVKNNGIVNSSGDFNVGDIDTSNGTLILQDSAAVNSTGNVFIGKNGTTGTLNMSGTSTMTSAETNVAGNAGSLGNMDVAGSAVFTSNSRLHVGPGAGSVANVVIEGSGKVVVHDYCSVGYNGGGSMTVKDGGIFIGDNDFSVNENGDVAATLTLQDTGSMTVGGTTFVGRNGSRVGTVTQTGGTYTGNGGEFQIGKSGTGTWLQSGGITNAGGWVSIGRQTGGVGVLTVSGTGTFNQTGAGNALIVGEDGTGTLNIQGSATVSSVGSVGLIVGNNGASGVGTVNLDGGTLAVRKIFEGGGSSSFNFNGGVLKANAGADLNFMGGLDSVNVKPGGAVIDSNGQTIAISQVLGDLGGNVTKQGAGTLQLNAANPYLGTTTVNGGALGGTGSVGGELVVSASGSVAPGASVGTFTVEDTLGAGSSIDGAYVCEVDGATADKLAIGGDLTVGAGAVLDFSTLSAPTAASYEIATFTSITGAFIEQNVPAGYEVVYNATSITLEQTATPYSTWASGYGLDPLTDGAPGVDKDGDGLSNIVEFALGGDPTSGSNNAKIYSLVADGDADPDSTNELILTIAVRTGTPGFTGTPSPTATKDGATYTIKGSTDLGTFTTTVTPISPVITGLPAAPSGYEYRSFSLDGSNGMPTKGFLRVEIGY